MEFLSDTYIKTDKKNIKLTPKKMHLLIGW